MAMLENPALGTPTLAVLSNRGTTVRTLTYNRAAVDDNLDERIERTEYSALGFASSRIDARLFSAGAMPNFAYTTSLTGGALRTASVDAGTSWALVDVDGRPVWARDARGTVTTWTYDALGRPLRANETIKGQALATRDVWMYGETEANAQAHNLRGRCVRRYDTAGRLIWSGFRLTGEPVAETRQLLVDAEGEGDWTGHDESAWAEKLDPTLYTTGWSHDATGVWCMQGDAKGNSQARAFDVAGRLLSSNLTFADGNARPVLSAIDYSAAGQVLSETAGNGVVSTYGYEPETQRLMRLTVARPAVPCRAAILQDLHYTYDPVGNVLSVRDDAQATTYWRNQKIEAAHIYAYDALYQLITATGREMVNRGQQGVTLPAPMIPLPNSDAVYTNYARTYSYDRGGNLTKVRHQGGVSYTQTIVVSEHSNHALQQNADGTITPANVDNGTWFDAAGNQRQLLPDRLQPLAWNNRNRLIRVTQVKRDGPPDDQEVYQYGADGMRVRKLTRIHTGSVTRMTDAIYLPGLTLRVTRSDDGQAVKVVEAQQEVKVDAGRAGVRALRWESGQPPGIKNDAMRYGIGDLIDSIGLELDDQAELISREEYYPYGGTAVWTARSQIEADTKFIRYSGKERDATGLYDYGWRSYQPWLGRWLNADPAGTVDGLNLFAIVKNNPLRFEDPDGRIKQVSQTINTIRLEKGHISVLSDRGLFVGSGEAETNLQFSMHRYDSVARMDRSVDFENISIKEGGGFYGAISIFSGSQVTSAESGSATIGKYWGRNILNSNVIGINVVNGMSGTVGIRIPFESMQRDQPVVVTSGALSGCTMIYSVDDNNFYAFHTGQKPGDDEWKTGQHGIVSTHESYQALTGKAISLTSESHNNDLVDLFSNNNKTVISYMGKSGTKITKNNEKVELFDYNEAIGPNPRAGYSYALLSRGHAGVKVKVLSEDVSISMTNGELTKLASLKMRLV
ncbi:MULTISPECIES: cytotoxic necrotizing factor Rho-activating domain-containing protein [Burkholderia]|uniref:cytotoxic necrotizing factor Rho-activating domain-containing protein n=1 Tax=Burkholderia TaxID=32008 RepID=UPI0008417D5C|nr:MULTISPECIES: cytotoxic necrotizing factor Rho-activating domain-containing protein [unclassified Burkholderia]AOK29745.1 hypothetical protein AQ611_10230 [Burkholderia sp. Bp7605]